MTQTLVQVRIDRKLKEQTASKYKVFYCTAALVLASAGCRSIPATADGGETENIPLRAMAHNTRSPEVGKIYVHKGGRSLKVIQVLKGGVLVHPMVGNTEFSFRGFAAFDEKMTIYVETSQDYIDNEYLRKGLYEYVGHYTYTAVSGAIATVRRFRFPCRA